MGTEYPISVLAAGKYGSSTGRSAVCLSKEIAHTDRSDRLQFEYHFLSNFASSEHTLFNYVHK
jgi:hypothetical protein